MALRTKREGKKRSRELRKQTVEVTVIMKANGIHGRDSQSQYTEES